MKYKIDLKGVILFRLYPFEKPVYEGFHSATCWLLDYKWENIDGFSEEEIRYFQEYLVSVAHIIMQLAREGGMNNVSSF